MRRNWWLQPPVTACQRKQVLITIKYTLPTNELTFERWKETLLALVNIFYSLLTPKYQSISVLSLWETSSSSQVTWCEMQSFNTNGSFGSFLSGPRKWSWSTKCCQSWTLQHFSIKLLKQVQLPIIFFYIRHCAQMQKLPEPEIPLTLI